jgi:uncharacterized protein Smg (DUF494 family)
MQERIIEIIVYLLVEIQQDQPKETYIDLSRELISKGYTENEINIAFSWIFNHLQREHADGSDVLGYSGESVRILHDLERLVVSPEGYGYVLQLLHLGVLSEYDVELIIEKALSIGTANVTLDDIKSIVASLVFGTESTNSFDGFFFHQGTNTIH